MDLKALKNLFFNFLKQFNEKEVYLLMDYLGALVQEYEKDYSKFYELINKESNKRSNLFENLMLSIERSQDLQKNYDQEETSEESHYSFCNETPDKMQTNNARQVNENNSPVKTTQIKPEPLEPIVAANEKSSDTIRKTKTKSQVKQLTPTLHNESKRSLRNSAIKITNFYKESRSKRNSHMTDTLNEMATSETDSSKNDRSFRLSTNDSTNGSLEQSSPVLSNSQIEFEIKVENNGRYRFGLSERTYLVSKYKENRYPDSNEIQKIAAHTKLTRDQVFMWFKDMRRKYHHTNPNKFNSNIVDILVNYYNLNSYPTVDEVEEMSAKTNLTRQQIVQWFQDRRYRTNQTKRRSRYSREVISLMRRKFQSVQYPTNAEIREMSKKTKLTHQQIYAWFKNQRKKSLSGEQTI